MQILDELGLFERFLERPHSRLRRADLRLAGRIWRVAELSRLHTVAPFIAIMPQWDFLDFLRDEAQAYPGFSLAMDTPVAGFLEDGERVAGVRLKDGTKVRSRLTIAADGRSSIVRERLPLEALGTPIDVLWFRISKQNGGEGALRFSIGGGAIVVLMDRDTYWQCAFVIPKGRAQAMTANGIEPIRRILREAAPDLDVGELKDTSDLKLLSVTIDRLTRWDCPGLLAIGDAAHAMSPIGGVGINLAIQDAVAAANFLAGPLARGAEVSGLLHRVQQRRMLPTRVLQRVQTIIQDRIIWPVLQNGDRIEQAPLAVRLLDRFPPLRRLPGRLMGLGVRRERVRSPAAPTRP